MRPYSLVRPAGQVVSARDSELDHEELSRSDAAAHMQPTALSLSPAVAVCGKYDACAIREATAYFRGRNLAITRVS
jgi:hypothetical protein